MKFLLYFLSFAGSAVFTYFLPTIWWEVSWQDLVQIVSNSDASSKLANSLTDVLSKLGIISENMQRWASERIVICIAIGLGIFLVLAILIHLIFRTKKKQA